MSNPIEISLEALSTVTGGAGDGSFPVHLGGGVPMADGGRGPSDFSCTSSPGSSNMSCKATSGDSSGASWSIPKSWAGK
ncbi:MAG TPA: hypothetical protein VGL61_24190 [Kofleriaceae bacterium]|jgi:hypothetical protein